jgi:hypothetical protein
VKGKLTSISNGSFSLQMDDRANLRSFAFQGKSLPLSLDCTMYELNGQPARVLGSGSREAFTLQAEDASAALILKPGKSFRYRCPEVATHRYTSGA